MYYWNLAIPYIIAALGCFLLLIAPFTRRFRDAPRWIRSGFLIASPLGLAWSGLGFYLLSHHVGTHTDLSWSRFWFLHCTYLTVGGMALGIFITLVVSPDFYKRHDRGASV
jgi:hypothetical protein